MLPMYMYKYPSLSSIMVRLVLSMQATCNCICDFCVIDKMFSCMQLNVLVYSRWFIMQVNLRYLNTSVILKWYATCVSLIFVFREVKYTLMNYYVDKCILYITTCECESGCVNVWWSQKVLRKATNFKEYFGVNTVLISPEIQMNNKKIKFLPQTEIIIDNEHIYCYALFCA